MGSKRCDKGLSSASTDFEITAGDLCQATEEIEQKIHLKLEGKVVESLNHSGSSDPFHLGLIRLFSPTLHSFIWFLIPELNFLFHHFFRTFPIAYYAGNQLENPSCGGPTPTDDDAIW